MPIEIEIRTIGDRDFMIIDGHPMNTPEETTKASHILDMLEYLGYITIKVTEE